jgi:O-antigen/teichoic acid export membrane protein
MVTRAANLVVIAALARSAGAQAVGDYGLATLGGSFVALLTSCGLPAYLTRTRAASELDVAELSAVHVGRAFACAVTLGVAGAVCAVVLSPAEALGVWALMAAVVLDQLNESAWASIRGTRRAHLEAIVNGATYAVLGVLAVGIALAHSLSIAVLGVTAAVIALGRSLIAAKVAGLQSPEGLVQVRVATVHHVRRAIHYLGSDVLGLAYLRGDTLVLALFVSRAALGGYVSAAALTAPLVQVGSAMGAGALAAATRDRDDPTAVVDFFLRVGVVVTAGLSVMVPLAIALMYGATRPAVIHLALILALFLPLRFFNFGLSSIALARGEAAGRFYVVVASVVVNVVLNLILDPFLGAAGAAWATVATEAFVSGAFLMLVRDRRLMLPAIQVAAVFAGSTICESVSASAIPAIAVGPVLGASLLCVLACSAIAAKRARSAVVQAA